MKLHLNCGESANGTASVCSQKAEFGYVVAADHHFVLASQLESEFEGVDALQPAINVAEFRDAALISRMRWTDD